MGYQDENTKVGTINRITKKPRKDSRWSGLFNFIDDYLGESGIVSDRDFLTKKKTYRYKIQNTIDLKMQSWKPAAEYWMNEEKTQSIEFIFWDHRLGNGGGPIIQFKKAF